MMQTTSPKRLTATLARCAFVAVAGFALATSSASAQDAAALAQAAQNPISSMISLPLQSNTNFDVGPLESTQEIFNIQPVYPFNLNDEWNLITRTIVPVISQPAFTSSQDRESGIGDIQFSTFLSPKKVAGGWVWGAGAIAQFDTATDDRLGQGAWGLGPTVVALHLGKIWVCGALVNNVWSVVEGNDRSSVNQMLVQPFINYNFPNAPGRYLTFSPVITADWEADSDQRWVVPLGLGIGQIMRFGKQPVNLMAGAYYNVERPDNAARWQLRLQMQLMFPK
jgi:hypothetical protein